MRSCFNRTTGLAATAIFVGFRISIRGQNTQGNRGNLEALARATGGEVYGPLDTDEVLSAFLKTARDLESQYILAYASTPAGQEEEYREIRIRVRDEDLEVRARRGYYAQPAAPER